MEFLLRKFCSSSKERSFVPARRPALLAVEMLESRCLLSAGFGEQPPILPALPLAGEQIASTVPPTGEGNPYGVAFVPQGFKGHGMLKPGDLLVSNFNGSSGVQGTGTTIERITSTGHVSTFFTSTLVGLDTALGVLRSGFVIVGNLPNDNGAIGQGALQFLNANGTVVKTLTDATLLDGPWDLTINDQGDTAEVFVANVLSGTVTRIDLSMQHGGLQVTSETQIASGYAHHPDAAALVVGPTGLAFDAHTGTLFVASTADNGIFAIANAATTTHDAGMGTQVVHDDTHLHGPLGLVLAPNGDLIAANGDAVNPGGTPNDLVEFDRQGHFVGDFQVDPGAPGAAFGIAITHRDADEDNGHGHNQNGGDDHGAGDDNLRFAAVNDNANTVEVFTLSFRENHGDNNDDDQGQNQDQGQRQDQDVSPHATPITQLAVDIRSDLNDLQEDAKIISQALAANTSASVQADLASLNSSLANVLADVQMVKDATADLNAAMLAGTSLSNDLGTNVSESLEQQLRDLHHDLIDLSRDLRLVSHEVSGNLTDIRADAQAIAQTLAANSSSAVQADVTAVNAALAAVAADLTAGQPAATDIGILLADIDQLRDDLQHQTTGRLRHMLADLRVDVKTLSVDLTLIKNATDRTIKDVQTDAAALTKALASNTDASVQADVTAMNTHLSALAADIAANKSAVSDLDKLIADVSKLTSDLGTGASVKVQQQLQDLGDDLLELAIELAAVRV